MSSKYIVSVHKLSFTPLDNIKFASLFSRYAKKDLVSLGGSLGVFILGLIGFFIGAKLDNITLLIICLLVATFGLIYLITKCRESLRLLDRKSVV